MEAVLRDSKDKIKSIEGSGMETAKAEQLDVLLNQSTKVLIKIHDTEEMDVCMTSKWDTRYPFSFDSKDTQTEIIRAEKDTTSIPSKHQLSVTRVNKFLVSPQKLVLTSLDIPKEQLVN